jgi:hypothetical protein
MCFHKNPSPLKKFWRVQKLQLRRTATKKTFFFYFAFKNSYNLNLIGVFFYFILVLFALVGQILRDAIDYLLFEKLNANVSDVGHYLARHF